MRTTSFMLALGAGVLIATLPARAHHAFAAEFDINKPITLSGTVTKIAFTNPHCWIYLDVKKADGSTENWALELGSPNELLRQGLRRTDVPAGTAITIQGHLAKEGIFSVPTAHADSKTIKLPGGRLLDQRGEPGR
jgi:uncharacterized protein DUF6152